MNPDPPARTATGAGAALDAGPGAALDPGPDTAFDAAPDAAPGVGSAVMVRRYPSRRATMHLMTAAGRVTRVRRDERMAHVVHHARFLRQAG